MQLEYTTSAPHQAHRQREVARTCDLLELRHQCSKSLPPIPPAFPPAVADGTGQLSASPAAPAVGPYAIQPNNLREHGATGTGRKFGQQPVWRGVRSTARPKTG